MGVWVIEDLLGSWIRWMDTLLREITLPWKYLPPFSLVTTVKEKTLFVDPLWKHIFFTKSISHFWQLWYSRGSFLLRNGDNLLWVCPLSLKLSILGPVVQSIVSLTSSLKVISLTVLVDSIYNILIFFDEKVWVAFALQKLLTFFSKNFQHICVSLSVNFNESLTNDVVSFEQLGPG